MPRTLRRLLALSLFFSLPAHAGPWAREAGSVYGKLGVGRFAGQAYFEDNQLPFVGDALEGYAELGLGGGLEIDAASRLVWHRMGQASSAGAQDLEVTADWSPVSGSSALAFSFGTRLPLYRRGLSPELGPGGADVLLGFGYGRSLGPAWTALDLQLRHRLFAPSSGVRMRFELGVLGDSPVGAALLLEAQPAFGRSDLEQERTIAPVPRALAIGAKGFVRLSSRIGATIDGAWLPDLFNDGPGYRMAAGLTFESPQ